MKNKLFPVCVLLILFPFIAFSQKKQITVEDIYQYNTFRTKRVSGFNSMKDGRYYTRIDDDGNLVKKKL